MGKRLDTLLEIVVETVTEAGEMGAPAGPMYAAFMQFGFDLQTFEALMLIAQERGLIYKVGDCYFKVK